MRRLFMITKIRIIIQILYHDKSMIIFQCAYYDKNMIILQCDYHDKKHYYFLIFYLDNKHDDSPISLRAYVTYAGALSTLMIFLRSVEVFWP